MNWSSILRDLARASSRGGGLGAPRPYRRRPKKSALAVIITAILAAVVGYTQYRSQSRNPPSRNPPSHPTASQDSRGVPVGNATFSPSDGEIPKFFAAKQSNVIVRAGGTVERILPDDSDTSDGSSRHQRFIVRLPGGIKVLIAHNIDLAGRLPVRVGQTLGFKGEYEYSEDGGVVHWTHRDPRGRHAEGWIELDGKKYQ